MIHAPYSSLYDEILLNGQILPTAISFYDATTSRIKNSATPQSVLDSFITITAGLTGLNQSISSIQASIAADATDNSALHSGLTGLSISIAELQASIAADATDNSELHANITEINGTLVTLQTNLSGLDGSLTQTISSLELLSSTTTTSLLDITSSAQVLTGRVDTLETKTATLELFSSTTTTTLGDITSSAQELFSNVSTLETTLNEKIDNTASALNTSISGNVADLITYISGNNDALNSAIVSVGTTISTLETTLNEKIDNNILNVNDSLNSGMTGVYSALTNWSSNTATSTLDMNLHNIIKCTGFNGGYTDTIFNINNNASSFVFQNNIIVPSEYVQNDISIGEYSEPTVFISSSNNLVTSQTNASMSGFNNISCSTMSLGTDLQLSESNNSLVLGRTGGVGIIATFTTDSLNLSNTLSHVGSTASLGNGALLVTNNVISTNTGAGLTGFNEITCNVLNYTKLNPAVQVYENTYFVDPAGSDTNSGKAEFPFKTISRAIAVCEGKTGNVAQEIRVNFGSYAENLTITKSRIQISAVGSRYVNTACSITGSININITSGTDMFNSQVAFIGFQMTKGITDISSAVHTLVLKDCYIYPRYNAVTQSSSADSRTYLEGCTIANGTSGDTGSTGSTGTTLDGPNALLYFTTGGISIINCQVTQKAKYSCLVLAGTASFYNCALNTFTNDNTGAVLHPILQITTSSVASQVIANCGFVYTSATSKVHTSSQCNNVGIWMNWGNGLSGGIVLLTLLSNTFFLLGTSESNLIVDSLTAAFYLLHSNCYTGHSNLAPQAHTMCGVVNTNKFQLCPAS